MFPSVLIFRPRPEMLVFRDKSGDSSFCSPLLATFSLFPAHLITWARGQPRFGAIGCEMMENGAKIDYFYYFGF